MLCFLCGDCACACVRLEIGEYLTENKSRQVFDLILIFFLFVSYQVQVFFPCLQLD